MITSSTSAGSTSLRSTIVAQHVGGEVDGVDVLQLAVAASERGADGVDDDGGGHGCLQRACAVGADNENLTERSSLVPGPQSGQTRSACHLFRHAGAGSLVHCRRARLLIIRHGESEWNVERRWQGWLDAPLTARARSRPRPGPGTLAHDGFAPRDLHLRPRAGPPDRGDHRRPRRGARSSPDAGFRERNGGEWEGRTGDEIDERWPGMRDAWRRGELTAPPGGEEDDDGAGPLRRRARARARARRRGRARASSPITACCAAGRRAPASTCTR